MFSHQGDTAAMSEPLIVVIPHRVGKDEALRRIKEGLGRAKSEFAWLLTLEEETWTGDRLTFSAAALGQRASGTIDAFETGVRLRGHACCAGAFRSCRATRHRTKRPIDAGKVAAISPRNCREAGQSILHPRTQQQRLRFRHENYKIKRPIIRYRLLVLVPPYGVVVPSGTIEM